MRIHLIMPMAGAGSRFYKNGFMVPKPLIEIKGKPFFFWATRSIEKFVEVEDITFIILKEHVENYLLDIEIKKFFPDAKIIILPDVTMGPVFTCLYGVERITDDMPLVFNDCDHMFKSQSFNNFIQKYIGDVDGALATFISDSSNFSYVNYGKDGEIIGTVEKKVVSNRAICGAYFFKSANLFKKIASEYIEKCPYKETFLSGMYNVMSKKRMLIKDFVLDYHVEFGTPEEYEKAINSPYFFELLKME